VGRRGEGEVVRRGKKGESYLRGNLEERKKCVCCMYILELVRKR